MTSIAKHKKTTYLEQEEWVKKSLRIIQRLLREKGIYKYEIFNIIPEASVTLPGNVFPISGTLLTKTGRIYHFWLDWGEVKRDYSLGDLIMPDGSVSNYWREVDPSEYERFEQNENYQNARKKLGLGSSGV